MAIEITKMSLPITPARARDIIQRNTDEFGVFFDLDRMLEYEAGFSIKRHKLYKSFFNMCGDSNLRVTKTQAITDIIENRFGVPASKLKNSKGRSSDASVRENLLIDPTVSEDAKEFIRTYSELSKLEYYISYLNQYISLPLSVAQSITGNRMTIGHPTWELLATSRISAKDPSIQNIARDLPDIMTCPQGYIMMRGDSGQIEPRINFSYFIRDELMINLITAYDDAYYGMLHYVLASPEMERNLRNDFNSYFVKREITPELEDLRVTLKTLANAGSYGSSNLEKVDKGLADAFTRKIVNHPGRLELDRRIRQDVENGIETFYGAFGTPITPESTTKYEKGGPGWKNHLVRCGVNNPVQTTASELMIHSVYTADKILQSYNKSYICYYKHDEGCFYISEDEDILLDKLKDVTAYNVHGWIPIKADQLIGVKKNKANPSIL